ncbi:MAG: GMC oxidoreductase, partial [Putridiphycobacter sp.]|nr:GMC oxidoreductase [Putridiphycobacter sp.]
TNISTAISGSPSPNLVAGGARFGNDPNHSVLDANCKLHDCNNVYISDASFMPTGGSVPYTWTIYANAFRVADIIKKELSKKNEIKSAAINN